MMSKREKQRHQDRIVAGMARKTLPADPWERAQVIAMDKMRDERDALAALVEEMARGLEAADFAIGLGEHGELAPYWKAWGSLQDQIRAILAKARSRT